MYKPTPIDIAWARSTVNLIRDGGVLSYPSTRMIFTVHHQSKTLKLVNAIAELAEDQRTILNQTIAVFQAMGWKVE